MADDPLPVLWVQAGGILAAGGAAFGAAFRWINARFHHHNTRIEQQIDKLRTERHDGDQRLWVAINSANAESAQHRALVATREELQAMFRDHERRMERLFRTIRRDDGRDNQ